MTCPLFCLPYCPEAFQTIECGLPRRQIVTLLSDGGCFECSLGFSFVERFSRSVEGLHIFPYVNQFLLYHLPRSNTVQAVSFSLTMICQKLALFQFFCSEIAQVSL